MYLDVDGVLNNSKTTTKVSGFTGVDPELRDRFLNFMKEAPDTFVILSSTWRQHEDMKQGLHDAGIRWEGQTLRLGGIRGEEIKLSVETYDPSHYVILDDNSDMLREQLPYFVQTDYRLGLQDHDVQKMRKILDLGN